MSFQSGLGQTATPQTLTILSSPTPVTVQVAATTSNGGQWLQFLADSGVTPVNLSVAPASSTLSAGTYQGDLTITALGASNSPLIVHVTLTVAGSGPTQLTATPATLNFASQLNGAAPPSQAVTIGSSTGSSVGFTVNIVNANTTAQWLSVAPAGGNTPQVLNFTVNPNGLTGGQYTATVNATPNAPGASSTSIQVNYSLSTLPTLNYSPARGFQFLFQAGTQALPSPQALTLSTTSGTVTVGLQATTDSGVPWLVLGQTQAVVGTTPQQIPIILSPVVASLPAGSYSGAVILTAPGATNPSVALAVNLLISSTPLMVPGNTPTTFQFRAGYPPPQAQNMQIGVSSGQLPFNASVQLPPGENWLSVAPTSGALPNTLVISVNATGLQSGNYSGLVVVDSPGAANSPYTFPVTLSVSANGLISVTPDQMVFNYQIGMASPPTQQLTIGTTGGTAHFDLQAQTNTCGPSWLSVTPTSGTAPTKVQVSINAAGQAIPQPCSGRIVIVGQNGAQTIVPVTMIVSTTPLLNLTPPVLAFTGPTSGAAPPNQFIDLSSSDPNTPINYTTQIVTNNGGKWLTVPDKASGQTPAHIPVFAVQGNLLPGTYSGFIQIQPVGLPSIQVPVTMVVTSNINMGVAPPSISFTTSSGVNPTPQILIVSSQGGTLPVAVAQNSANNWLRVTPLSGTTPLQLIISAETTGLPPANYDGTITVSSSQAANQAIAVPVTLSVGPPQSLTTSPAAVNFTYALGDPQPAAIPLTLTPKNGTLAYTATAAIRGSGNWLTVSPNSGTAPDTLQVMVDPTNLAPAVYTGSITINAPGIPPTVVIVTLTITGPPQPSLVQVLNAASQLDGPVAPGEVILLTGSSFSPSADLVLGASNADGTLPTAIGDTTVLFDTTPAPILAAQANKLWVVAPYEINQPATIIQVKRKSVGSNPVQIPTAPTAPGIFNSNIPLANVGVILNADGTPNSAANPAPANTNITIYYTGEGQTSPPSTTGSITPPLSGNPPTATFPLSATIGGQLVGIPSYGPAPGQFAGLSMASLTVPAGTGGGAQPVTITSNGVTSAAPVFVYIGN